jgi:hypothetical protein
MPAAAKTQPAPEPSFAEQFAAAAAKFKADYATLVESGELLLELELDYQKLCYPSLPRGVLAQGLGVNTCTCLSALRVAELKHD